MLIIYLLEMDVLVHKLYTGIKILYYFNTLVSLYVTYQVKFI